MNLPDGPLVVEIAKVAGYLLNAAHPTGNGKAAFFTAFGFDPAAPLDLARALTALATERDVTGLRDTPFGKTYEVRCSIRSPDGRNPCIVSIWFAATGANGLRLVTAYPAPTSP